MQKEPTDRLTIRDILEHPWLQKYHKSNLPEMRRRSRDLSSSIFKMYSTCDDNSNLNINSK